MFYLSCIYKLERILIVLNSPKTVGMHLFPNFISITSKKKVIILNYRQRTPLSSTKKGVR